MDQSQDTTSDTGSTSKCSDAEENVNHLFERGESSLDKKKHLLVEDFGIEFWIFFVSACNMLLREGREKVQTLKNRADVEVSLFFSAP
jgi:hypothetical protein